jgi:hypothetical protein
MFSLNSASHVLRHSWNRTRPLPFNAFEFIMGILNMYGLTDWQTVGMLERRIKSEVSSGTECDEVFAGDHPRQHGVKIRRSRGCLCYQALMWCLSQTAELHLHLAASSSHCARYSLQKTSSQSQADTHNWTDPVQCSLIWILWWMTSGGRPFRGHTDRRKYTSVLDCRFSCSVCHVVVSILAQEACLHFWRSSDRIICGSMSATLPSGVTSTTMWRRRHFSGAELNQAPITNSHLY